MVIHTAKESLYKIKMQAYMNIQSKGIEFHTNVLIVPNLIYEVILHINMCQSINAVINFQNNTHA